MTDRKVVVLKYAKRVLVKVDFILEALILKEPC